MLTRNCEIEQIYLTFSQVIHQASDIKSTTTFNICYRKKTTLTVCLNVPFNRQRKLKTVVNVFKMLFNLLRNSEVSITLRKEEILHWATCANSKWREEAWSLAGSGCTLWRVWLVWPQLCDLSWAGQTDAGRLSSVQSSWNDRKLTDHSTRRMPVLL